MIKIYEVRVFQEEVSVWRYQEASLEPMIFRDIKKMPYIQRGVTGTSIKLHRERRKSKSYWVLLYASYRSDYRNP